jgi:cysteinyl-tRNA synthetase
VLLYDSLTRQKVELPPPPGPIRMYVCGPTVYQRIHIGNARPYIVFIWLKRWLEEQGYDVTLVENITDINDKIYAAAAREGIGSSELAAKATHWYIEDTDRLGLARPDVEPLATETVPEIVALIQELVGRGLAYESGGDVYFRVAAYPEYGELSRVDPEEMVAQEEPSGLKKDPRDFALWKATKPQEDTSWDSPWGKGRPGWHIECSAMAEKHLGPEFEIHGGGIDLRFPHHENELAQSRGIGHRFAHIWAHNGMLQLNEEKMSKSTGNIVSLREVAGLYGRAAVLVFFLGAHYRSPIDYSDEAMESAKAQAEGFRNAFRGMPRKPAQTWDAFQAALEDDFNTQAALAVLHHWRAAGEVDLLRRGLTLFGLESLTEEHPPPPEVMALALRRQEARALGAFDEADRLREQIESAGWEVRDFLDGFQVVPRS